ncbi:hypothetical protein RIF29_29780 [Crotalaria pallida]|uniref:DUF7477 domain-containing protein n=1 Tax=Crotalaria pallida TaxID=3830 RepID=A0AAN9ELZ4_CROPI
MATAGNRWEIVMSRGAGFSDQVVELDFLYPSEGIHRRWDNGYRITSTAATWDQAAFVLSVPRRIPVDETQETLRKMGKKPLYCIYLLWENSVVNCQNLRSSLTFSEHSYKLRKAFVSVKGIYYQANVEGQAITWLTPHSLQQVVSEDVDLPTMLNFLQLYEPLLGFVNFRLYHSINLKYPPLLDPRLEALAAYLYALSRYVGRNTRPSAVSSESVHLVEHEQVEAKQSVG